MKVRSFLMGGIIGASAVWLMTKKQHPLMNMAKMMMNESFLKNTKSNSKQAESGSLKNSDSSKMESESLVRSIIEQDPQLKQEFNAITKDTYVDHTTSNSSANVQLQ